MRYSAYTIYLLYTCLHIFNVKSHIWILINTIHEILESKWNGMKILKGPQNHIVLFHHCHFNTLVFFFIHLSKPILVAKSTTKACIHNQSMYSIAENIK